MMVERKVKKLPLVGPRGELIGLVTARDLSDSAGCRSPPATTRDACGSAPRSARKETISSARRN